MALAKAALPQDKRLLGAGVFALAALITLLAWALRPAALALNDSSDYISFYEPVARSLIAGHGFTLPDGTLAPRYPPGYPLILAAIFGFSSLTGVPEQLLNSLFSLLCAAGAAALVYLIGAEVWGPRRALPGALLFASYPFLLWLTIQPGSELPFVGVLYAAVLVLWRMLRRGVTAWPGYFACGALVGAAMLIRPIAAGLGLALAFAVVLLLRAASWRVRMLLAAALLAGNLLAVAPWELWLYNNSGQVLLLSDNGVPSVRDGLTFGAISKGYRGEVAAPPEVAALMGDVAAEVPRLQSYGDIAGYMLRQLGERPIAVGELIGIKALRSWYGTDSGRSELLIGLVQAPYVTLLSLALIGAIRRRGKARQIAVVLLLVALYCWLMTTAVLSILRYMVPAIGLLFSAVPALFPLRWPVRFAAPVALSRPQTD